MMKPWVWLAIFVTSLVIASGVFLGWQTPSTPAKTNRLIVQMPCDLNQSACQAADQQGHQIQFSLSPTPIPLMQNLTAQLMVKGWKDIQEAQVSIEGVNMYMGQQFTFLQPNATKQWHGNLMLPICSESNMQWQASVHIQSADKFYVATFPFMTTRP